MNPSSCNFAAAGRRSGDKDRTALQRSALGDPPGSLSLTPDFSPVLSGSLERKPFKRLLSCGRAGTRLKPGVNEKRSAAAVAF